VFQGMLLFFLLASDVLIRYRVRFGRRRPAVPAAPAVAASPVPSPPSADKVLP
jgi:hypothetical protein